MQINDIVLFTDYIGRTIIAEEIKDRSDEKNLVVKNPVIIQVIPTADKGVGIHFIPVFFRDFLAVKDVDHIWSYNKNNIVLADKVDLDARVYGQYVASSKPQLQQMHETQPAVPQNQGKVIKLFDD